MGQPTVGFNTAGQLGNGNTTSSNIPVAVAAPTGGSVLTFSSLETIGNHTCGLTTSGAAYCWGRGTSGQLGNGTSGTGVISNVPVPVSGGLVFTSLVVGNDHSCGLTRDTQEAYCWGLNVSGQLGNGTSGNGTNSNVPVPVSGGLTFSSLSGGNLHTCGVTTTNVGYCWGENSLRVLGTGNQTNSNVPVAVVAPTGGSVLSFSSIQAGREHTCAITTAGAGYCWGNGANGRLGDNAGASSTRPVAVAAPTGGSVLTFSSIQAGGSHSCGLTTTGLAYCWGEGLKGKLGTGSTSNANVPASVVSTNYNL
jgi:alpha-tubulin suppressor-like RCC1 family protein